MICRLCKTTQLGESDRDQICESCRKTLHVAPMPPPRRPPIPCAKCGGMRFVRGMIRELVTLDSPGASRTIPLPVAVTWDVTSSEPLRIGVVTIGGVKLGEPRGQLARYLCAGCGFVEVYCDDPESVPIGPEYGTDLVEYLPTRL